MDMAVPYGEEWKLIVGDFFQDYCECIPFGLPIPIRFMNDLSVLASV